jgi:hypothetical protein
MNPAFFQLNVHFSVEKLEEDLAICKKDTWTSHFNTNDYNGNWNSISLRSASGHSNDIRSLANQVYQNTPLLEKCLYFQEIISWFNCEKEAVRLLNLAPQSEIKEHTDNDTSYEDGFFRIHIPISTNPQVLFYVNKQLVPMKIGECWYANFQLPHSVQNNSNEPRVHLIIDCIRNQWSDELFSKAGYDTTLKSSKHELTDSMKQQIISELMRNPTETNLKLIANLQG